MLEYLITGKYPEKSIYTHLFGCIDRAFTTIKKFKTSTELDEQYDIVAKLLGFANRFEYFVYSIIALINNNTLAIVARQDADFELPTTVSSSSTASVVYGMEGIDRHSSSRSKGNTIFTLHPQAKVSGNGKKNCYEPFVDDMNDELLRTLLPILNLGRRLHLVRSRLTSFRGLDKNIEKRAIYHWMITTFLRQKLYRRMVLSIYQALLYTR